MSEILTGTVLDFPYTGAVEEITLPKGAYRLECWGAQGGDANATYSKGGRGGYASGVLRLKRETKMFVRSGQSGPVPTQQGPSAPAFNGGGTANTATSTTSASRVTSGGGASDIRIGGDSLFARVIVAGAGGGSGYASASQHPDGGYGGGETGGNGGSTSDAARCGYGGTQTEGGGNGYNTVENYGSFGQGGSDATSGQSGCGGGGGWYGGGASDGYYQGGGGGSGFVWTGVNAPDGYLLTEEHHLAEAQNIAGNTAFAAPDGTTETGHSGDGYVRITALEVILEPNAPENFRVEAEADTNIMLAWDPAKNATGYRLRLGGSVLVDTTETFASALVEPFANMMFTLAAYNDEGESVPAELTYRKIPENPILFLVTDRTRQDVTAGNFKGYYSATDLNRVGYAVEYLAERLKKSGVAVSVLPSTEWADTDWATPSDMAHYLEQVRIMREVLTLVSPPSVPDDLEKFTYTEANQIEQILEMLDAHITNMLSVVDAGWATGTAYTGFYAKEAY